MDIVAARSHSAALHLVRLHRLAKNRNGTRNSCHQAPAQQVKYLATRTAVWEWKNVRKKRSHGIENDSEVAARMVNVN